MTAEHLTSDSREAQFVGKDEAWEMAHAGKIFRDAAHESSYQIDQAYEKTPVNFAEVNRHEADYHAHLNQAKIEEGKAQARYRAENIDN